MKYAICKRLFVLAMLALPCLAATARAGELEIRVVDSATGLPVPVRMHIVNKRGQAQELPDLPNWGDHFSFDGHTVLVLPTGEYQFVIEHGPEYRLCTGYFSLTPDAADNKSVEMVRFMNMPAQGWYSGDLAVYREVEDIEHLLRAEDLYVAPVTTWSNDENLFARELPPEPLVATPDGRFYQLLGGAADHAGGCLRLFNLPEPLPLADYEDNPRGLLEAVRATQSGHADIGLAASWDTPAWLATGMIDSICLADEQLGRNGTNETNYELREPVGNDFPGPHSAGLWAEKIYYELLNTGLRIAPSAGSGSGQTPNPLGYNRAYVFCGTNFNYENWWANLRNGQVVITNGPMLMARANGYYPGHVFRAAAGESVEIDIAAGMGTRDAVTFLEIVRNGEVVEQVRLQDWANANGQLPKLTFQESGWFLIRAVTLEPGTYRYATSAPFYVEIGGEPRIGRAACEFFLDWEQERIEDLEGQRRPVSEGVLQFHQDSLEYWEQRLSEANAP